MCQFMNYIKYIIGTVKYTHVKTTVRILRMRDFMTYNSF